MKKSIIIILVFPMFFACGKSPEQFISHLNGYWEIDEVTLPDGSKRDYVYNDTIDYLSITDSLTGFRKKLKPDFNGKFVTSDDAEALELKIEDHTLYIYYTTPYANWKETVLKATDTQLLIENDQNIKYLYKRYIPMAMAE